MSGNRVVLESRQNETRLLPLPKEVSAFEVAGVVFHSFQIDTLTRWSELAIQGQINGGFVTFSNMHIVVEAWTQQRAAQALKNAAAVVPDGYSAVVAGRLRGANLKARCYGPDFMHHFFAATGGRYRHFLLGSTTDVLALLNQRLVGTYGAQIVGTYSPPMGSPESYDFIDIATKIQSSGANVLWVGLGAPKQEIFMDLFRQFNPATITFGVGAAFDFVAGSKPQAPRWARDSGFEWLFRLVAEPRRLWRRYLVTGPAFILLFMLDLIGMLRFLRRFRASSREM